MTLSACLNLSKEMSGILLPGIRLTNKMRIAQIIAGKKYFIFTG